MFTSSDFDIFNDPTLAGRMGLIKTVLDPKFEAIAPTIMATLKSSPDQQFYAHVAKHLRRFKNPPVDTWVAFSENARRYKALPHFELGLWPDRLFIYFDILDEGKAAVQAALTPTDLQQIYQQVPADFVISHNHGVATTQPATPAAIDQTLKKFAQYKHSELVVGRAVMSDADLLADPAALEAYIIATFKTLMTIYQPVMAALPSQ